MLGRELQYLANTADLARLDLEVASVHLNRDGSRLVAKYTCAYAMGQRWVEVDSPDISMAVSARQFKELAALFDDDEQVELSISGPNLNMTSQHLNIAIRNQGPADGIEPYGPMPDDVQLGEIKGADLRREVEVAAHYIAPAMSAPVLGGICLNFAPRGAKVEDKIVPIVSLQSFNSRDLLFRTQLEIKNCRLQRPQMTVCPTLDLILGLRLVGDETIRVVQPAGRKNIFLFSDSAVFMIAPLISDQWPTTNSIAADQARVKVEADGRQLQKLTRGAKALEVSADLVVRGNGRELVFETQEAETGKIIARIPSTVRCALGFDLSSFILAQELGSDLQINLPLDSEFKEASTLIVSGQRNLWMKQRWIPGVSDARQ